MAKRPNPVADLQRKLALIGAALIGRPSANPETLSRSFGLPVEHVRRIMMNAGVRDDG